MENGKQPALTRLMNKVRINGDCLEYTGAISTTGYGVFWLNGKNQNAHKASYLLNKGETNGMMVLHTCDNKACVNPHHLYLGTRLDNARDAVLRGRMATGNRHGSKTKPRDYSITGHPGAKFSMFECLEIFSKINSGQKMVALAQQYKVHLATIYRAREKAIRLLKQLEK